MESHERMPEFMEEDGDKHQQRGQQPESPGHSNGQTCANTCRQLGLEHHRGQGQDDKPTGVNPQRDAANLQ